MRTHFVEHDIRNIPRRSPFHGIRQENQFQVGQQLDQLDAVLEQRYGVSGSLLEDVKDLIEIRTKSRIRCIFQQELLTTWERRYNSPPIVPVIVPPFRS